MRKQIVAKRASRKLRQALMELELTVEMHTTVLQNMYTRAVLFRKRK